MKKYNAPLANIVEMQIKDVITVSSGAQGSVLAYSFRDIIADGSEWIAN